MPVPVLETYAKKSGKTLEEAEACWEKAKKRADHAFKDKPKDSHYWAYVNVATQLCLGINSKTTKKKKK